MENLISGLRRLEASMEDEVTKKNPLRMQTLKKLTSYLLGTDKPRRERLDRLSLLLGFQDWDSLHEALNGQDDGESNYMTTADSSKASARMGSKHADCGKAQ